MLKNEYKQIMKELLKDQYDKYIQSLQEEPVKAILCNTQKMPIFQVENSKIEGLQPMPYGTQYYYNTLGVKLGNHLLHLAGAFYCTEPSSMIVVESIKHLALQGKTVLDLCASPGGKSIACALAVGESGMVVSNEIVPSRAKILYSNIERLGLRNVIVTSADSEIFKEYAPHSFYIVLVDAPCSGEGMFRKNEMAQNLWSLEEVKSNAIKQLAILENACQCVKKGGYILYSTCTFNRMEDDDVIEQFLQKHPDFQKASINPTCLPYLKQSEYGYRFLPHLAKGEGQFLSLLAYIGEEEETLPKIRKEKNNKELALVQQWVKENFEIPFPLYWCMVGNKYCVSQNPITEYQPYHCLCYGVMVGEVVKGRVEPHHQLFCAYGQYAKRKQALDDKSAMQYVKGEEILVDLPNGYACVMYQGYTLGMGKVVNGVMKNKFPKGLRIP